MVRRPVVESPSSIRVHLRHHLPELFRIAFLATGSRDDALLQLRFLVNEAVAQRIGGPDAGAVRTALLATLVRGLDERLGGKVERTFDDLDALLRNDITRPIELGADPIGDDPRRLHVMLWQLKRTCLIATLCALPISLRLAFVLTDLAGVPAAEAADLLGINERAFRVRLTRARKRLESYCAPRCQHLDGDNPCTCVGRLAIAMDAGFVHYPSDADRFPDAPHDAPPSQRSVAAVLAELPLPPLEARDLDQLLSAI